jgi:uncharacterized membrane protein
MNALKHYRWGLAGDVVLALLGIVVINFGEVSGALLSTALVHSIIASLVYFRGRKHGALSLMDHAFLVFGQLGILLFLVLIFLFLWRYYLPPIL